MTPIDLHCHSNLSDGVLPPDEVMRRAAGRGCRLIALTDHDELSGLPRARAEAESLGMRFVDGVEISVTWRRKNLHVVGLNIDPLHTALVDGLRNLRAGRLDRAERIAADLAGAGIGGALEGARKYAINPEIISRTHFARYLVEIGAAKDVRSVFKRYLKRGKPGYVAHQWVDMSLALAWIRAAGGIAVLAHPGRYEIGKALMLELLAEFKDAGGEGIEVVTSNHDADQVRYFAGLAERFGFLASCGSDFHSPGETWTEPGVLPDLPYNCRPIWERFN